MDGVAGSLPSGSKSHLCECFRPRDLKAWWKKRKKSHARVRKISDDGGPRGIWDSEAGRFCPADPRSCTRTRTLGDCLGNEGSEGLGGMVFWTLCGGKACGRVRVMSDDELVGKGLS